MASNSKIRNSLLYLSQSIGQINLDNDHIDIVSVKTFIHILSDVEDFRVKGRCIYKIENLIIMIFFAVLAGHGSNCIDIADYVSLNKQMFVKWNILDSEHVPAHDTFRRLLMNLDTEKFKEVVYIHLNNFFEKLERTMPYKNQYRQLSVDGKELRGTGRAKSTNCPKGNLATLNIYDNSRGLVISASAIEKKESEIPKAREELEVLNLKKTIVTCDALHCQKDTAELIHKKQGYYLLIAKDNQALLSKDISSRIETEKKTVKIIEDEKRKYYFYVLPKKFIGLEWAGQKMYIKVESYVRNKTEPSIMYFLTNTTNKDLVIEAIENKWQIENDHHKNKDLLLDEDKFRIADKAAVANIVAIHDITLALFKIAFASLPELNTLKKTRMAFELQPEKYLMIVLSIINSGILIEKLKEANKKK